jgi:alpha-glucosidase
MRFWDAHHDGSPLYLPEPPVLGRHIPVRVRVPDDPDGPTPDHVWLRSVRDGEPLVVEAERDVEDAAGTWWTAELDVHNPLTSYRFLLAEGRSQPRWLNGTGVHHRDVTDAHDFRLSSEHRLPAWVLDQVGYQVFPDRFERTETGVALPSWAIPAQWHDPVVHHGAATARQLYGGTLDGVRARLSHLTDLGATLLYLTPVFEARSNHRYDAVSFDRVDSLLGGDEALSALIATAHDAGVRVMGDLTTNHTGSGHDWFTLAAADVASPERAFYLFQGEDYASWLGHLHLPKLDHRSSELARRLYDGPNSVVAHWLREGLAGWRVDVANMTGRFATADFAHDVARAIRRTFEEARPDAWLLAEHAHDASLDLDGSGWHGTMDYAGFTRPVWSWLSAPSGVDFMGLPVDVPHLPAQAVVATMREVHASMPWQALTASTMHLDSHDVARFRTVVGGGTDGWVDRQGIGRDRHLVGIALQMTMPGVPMVFAGDEIGLTGVTGEHARTPFPWQRHDWDEATLAAYRSWIALRRDHVALRRGGLRWLLAEGDSITYLREHPEQTVLVHLTRATTSPTRLPLRALGPDVHQVTPLHGAAPTVDGDSLVLAGQGPGALAAVVGP